MTDLPIGYFIAAFFFLLGLSAFFSGSETALMSLNRYRLRYLTEQGNRGARLASRLLDQPDRLIGLILIGNNFVNILITQLATYIGYRLFGSSGIAIATGVLTLLLLIFAEVAPKTLGALKPERFAFPASFVYTPLLKITYPLVWLINLFANSFLSLLGVKTGEVEGTALNSDELRTVVNDAQELMHESHHDMLLRILDLEKVTVEDIMTPKAEVIGIDLDEPWEEIEDQLRQVKYTRMPVYHGNIDNIEGYVHIRSFLSLLSTDTLTPDRIKQCMRKPYFVPDSTSVTQQLINFKEEHRRHALVVDEYGDVLGIVTMEDVLAEIAGEFSQDATHFSDMIKQPDGSWMIDGSANVREINRALQTDLPTDGPRTLNGLILEYLELIPENRLSVKIGGYAMEIIKTAQNAIKTVRLFPNRGDRNSDKSDGY